MRKTVVAILLLAATSLLVAYNGKESIDFLLGGTIAVVVVVGSVVPAIWLAFLPTLVAWGGEDQNTRSILLINLLLGWTIVGWFVALIWACQGLASEEESGAAEASMLDQGATLEATP